MTDHENMLSTPEELLAKPCDQWCELEVMSAYHAIKELAAERDRLLLEADPELPTIAYMTGAHDWKVRAEKAEADLAAARAELEQSCTGCVNAPECEGDNYDEECMNCRRFYGDGYIAAAQAEGGE